MISQHIHRATHGDIVVLAFRGKLTMGGGDAELRQNVAEALEAGYRKIVLNLGETTTVDSTGIGELVGAYTTTSNRGGKLKLAALTPKVLDILTITQLITVFDVYETAEEAIGAF
ncbi:MAG TPA: STAS domain-containing protein [Thermoanaerobaculia bacterium]|nr:STAS domain-containing protein [Thermoanaerobaculia bacterium]